MKIIKNLKFEGYVWMSDAQTPEVLVGEEFIHELRNDQNPFVIEAQLYNAEEKLSYSIKYVDGRYIVNTYQDMSPEDEDGDTRELLCYIGARGMSDRYLQFIQVWREEPDENCLGMGVLQPKERVFVGFKPLKEEK